MSERLYRPDKTWRREVSALDRELFAQGQTSLNTDSIVAVWGLEHILYWRHNKIQFGFISSQGPRLLRNPHWGSQLLQHTELTTDEQAYPVALKRRVTYYPRGIRAYGNYSVRDYAELLDIGEYIDLGMDEISKRYDKNVAEARKREKQLELSRPSEETYIFILNTLKQGEEETRSLSK